MEEKAFSFIREQLAEEEGPEELPEKAYAEAYEEASKEACEKVPKGLEALLQKYQDCIGYIEISDTNISYPIMQNADNEYYLHRNMDGEFSNSGCIYMDSNHDIEKRGLHVIYGHHMRNGTMFRDISRFTDSRYMETHQEITIQTAERKLSLKPVYCYSGKADSSYRSRITSPNQLAGFMKSHTGFELSVDDLYVLVTCSYGREEERTYLYCILQEQAEG